MVRKADEITEAYESAVREAVAAFGRGECFVERYLDRPRHVETQCLADRAGQRGRGVHPGLLAAAPAPEAGRGSPGPVPVRRAGEQLYASSKAILREAGYVGAGTCEFLVGQDGTVSFLEVNTRLQVEHPVSEEVTGIDLVREMFRIADGQQLDYPDPAPRGHSIEFRVNAEDAGRGFLPAPGTITELNWPSGPGVRVDAGYAVGMTVPQAFDSLLAKIIITGASRAEALQRARRALDECVVGGMPTVLPFHRAVVRDPAFTAEPFQVHTRWIETEFNNTIEPYSRAAGRAGRGRAAGADHGGGRRQAAGGGAARRAGRRRGRPRPARPGGRPAAAGRAATARARPPGTSWSARCRAPSPRSSRPKASTCRRATPWWCWKR